MPSQSQAQHNLMAGIAHGWEPSNPKLRRIPKSVAEEYVMADKKKKAQLQKKAMSKPSKPSYGGGY